MTSDFKPDTIVIDVELDPDERAALSLPPKFFTLGRVDMNEFELDLEHCNTKIRYDGYNNPKPQPGEEVKKETEEQVTSRLREEARATRVWHPHRMSLNAARRRVTDVEGNSHVIQPRPLEPSDEAELHPQKQRLTETVNKFILEDTRAGQPRSNLTDQEKRGIDKLKKNFKIVI